MATDEFGAEDLPEADEFGAEDLPAAPAPAVTVAEEPGIIEGLGRGLIAGFPGGKAAVAGIESALGPKTYEESRREVE